VFPAELTEPLSTEMASPENIIAWLVELPEIETSDGARQSR